MPYARQVGLAGCFVGHRKGRLMMALPATHARSTPLRGYPPTRRPPNDARYVGAALILRVDAEGLS